VVWVGLGGGVGPEGHLASLEPQQKVLLGSELPQSLSDLHGPQALDGALTLQVGPPVGAGAGAGLEHFASFAAQQYEVLPVPPQSLSPLHEPHALDGDSLLHQPVALELFSNALILAAWVPTVCNATQALVARMETN